MIRPDATRAEVDAVLDKARAAKYVIVGMVLWGIAVLYVLRRIDLGRDPLGDDDWSVP